MSLASPVSACLQICNTYQQRTEHYLPSYLQNRKYAKHVLAL